MEIKACSRDKGWQAAKSLVVGIMVGRVVTNTVGLDDVGNAVVGANVLVMVGDDVVGDTVVGANVTAVVGDSVAGDTVVGANVTVVVGDKVGVCKRGVVGVDVVLPTVGENVSKGRRLGVLASMVKVGASVGATMVDGASVGTGSTGNNVGISVGTTGTTGATVVVTGLKEVGEAVCFDVGVSVGELVVSTTTATGVGATVVAVLVGAAVVSTTGNDTVGSSVAETNTGAALVVGGECGTIVGASVASTSPIMVGTSVGNTTMVGDGVGGCCCATNVVG
jgi:hypothetical protein